MTGTAVEVHQKKWRNRSRVLVVGSRGTSFRDRHLIKDVTRLMPHCRTDSKIDKKQDIRTLNEICEMRNCCKCLYFENKKKKDLYLWMANVPRGPTVKFLIHNVHTMMELKLSGNCLCGSRPLLSFDAKFDDEPHLQLLKELLIQVFGVPLYHPQSQPFFDHAFSFSVCDGKVWFRNYQIVEETGKLEEIGPRMVLEPIKILEGSFGGPVLYQNPNYNSPNLIRRQMKLASAGKYVERVQAKASRSERREGVTETFKTDATDSVFEVPKPEPANETGEAGNAARHGKKRTAKNKRRRAKKAKQQSSAENAE